MTSCCPQCRVPRKVPAGPPSVISSDEDEDTDTDAELDEAHGQSCASVGRTWHDEWTGQRGRVHAQPRASAQQPPVKAGAIAQQQGSGLQPWLAAGAARRQQLPPTYAVPASPRGRAARGCQRHIYAAPRGGVEVGAGAGAASAAEQRRIRRGVVRRLQPGTAGGAELRACRRGADPPRQRYPDATSRERHAPTCPSAAICASQARGRHQQPVHERSCTKRSQGTGASGGTSSRLPECECGSWRCKRSPT